MNNEQYAISCLTCKNYFLSFLNRILFFPALLLSALLFTTTSVLAQEGQAGYQITSPVSGVIKKVYVKPGQTVKKGDLLLEYDTSLIVSNLSEAQANIKLAKINTAEAKKEFARAEELYDRTVLSEHELQLAKVLYVKALAQYAAADNQLVHARWNMKHSKLYAELSGQVAKVFSYPGQFVNNKLTAQTLLIIK